MKHKKTIILLVVIISVLGVIPFLPGLFVNIVREIPVNTAHLQPYDLRGYQGTPVWDLAKAVYDEDIDEIYHQVQDKKVPIDYREPVKGRTLLLFAACKYKPRSVKALLDLGADPNARDSFRGSTPLLTACRYNDSTEVVKLLLSYGADPNIIEKINNDTSSWYNSYAFPLYWAIGHENFENVKLLIASGADIHLKTEIVIEGSLVNVALVHDRCDIALYLINQGLDYNAILKSGGDSECSILSILRNKIYDLDSERYKDKMKLVEFLQGKGLDYRKEPIDEQTLKRIKRIHHDDWEEYIKKY